MEHFIHKNRYIYDSSYKRTKRNSNSHRDVVEESVNDVVNDLELLLTKDSNILLTIEIAGI